MQKPIYESISRYSTQNERFTIQSTPKKTRPVDTTPKEESLEQSKLAWLAKGGAWVLFALLYPFYFLLVRVPRWLHRWVWLTGVRIATKVEAALRSIYEQVTRPIYQFIAWIAHLSARIAHLWNWIFVQPIIRLKSRLQADIAKATHWFKTMTHFPQAIVSRFANRFKFPKVTLRRFKFPKMNFKLPKVNFKLPKVNFKFPKVNIKLPKVSFKLPKVNLSRITHWFKILQTIVRRIAQYVVNIRKRIRSKISAQVNRVRSLKLPKIKWVNPLHQPLLKLKGKVEDLKLKFKAFKEKIRLKFKAFKVPRLKLKMPKIEWKRPNLKKWIAPLQKRADAVTNRMAIVGQWVKVRLRFIPQTLNILSLLMSYWSRQAKAMLASSFKFD